MVSLIIKYIRHDNWGLCKTLGITRNDNICMKCLKVIIASGLLCWPSLEAMEIVEYCWEFWYQNSLVSGHGLEERLLVKCKTSFEDNDASRKSQKIDRFDQVNNQVNNQGQGLLDFDGLDVSYDTEAGDFQLVDHDCDDIDYVAIVDKKAALDGAAALAASGVADCDGAFYLAVAAFIDECRENSKDFEEPRKLLCRALLQRSVRECVVIVDEPGKLCNQIESEQVKERCKAAVQLYYLSLQLLRNGNSELARHFALLAVFYWLDEQPAAQWYKVGSVEFLT